MSKEEPKMELYVSVRELLDFFRTHRCEIVNGTLYYVDFDKGSWAEVFDKLHVKSLPVKDAKEA